MERACYAASVALLAALLYLSLPQEQGRQMLENSAPHVGAGRAAELGYTGSGVRVAVIDTGVDASHPDLAGRVLGGHDFVGGGPGDSNGHGTQVAGIIGAGGAVAGVAPGAVIVPYKVSEDGESVSSDLIELAIRRAAAEGADVINISLGIPVGNEAIDAAVAEAASGGAVVVVAAGNDGPGPSTIGSPGGAPQAITVGATHNNVRSSLVATLSAGQKQYDVAPMLGVLPTGGPITAPLADGGYGRPQDIGPGARGAILVMERGSDTEGELVYFTQKESNAADAGALAAVVYNNEPGPYLGDVSSGPSGGAYEPRIPILSIDREDGLELEPGGLASLEVFYNPDHVAFFSSRGPVSPFYVKPDLVAPGAFVNSTHAGGRYDLASGTSFAAPHVAGAAALLLEKHPGLSPSQVKSVLSSTASPSADSYGERFGPAVAGSGRLDAAAALEAELVLEPAHLVMTSSPSEPEARARVLVGGIGGPPPSELDVRASAPDGWSFGHSYSDGVLSVSASGSGQGWGRLHAEHGGVEYTVPVLARHTGGSIEARGGPGGVSVDVLGPDGWQYARAVAYDAQSGRASSASLLPGQQGAVPVGGPGKYWIEARIESAGAVEYAYSEASVDGGPYVDRFPQSAWLAALAAAAVAAAGFRASGRPRL